MNGNAPTEKRVHKNKNEVVHQLNEGSLLKFVKNIPPDSKLLKRFPCDSKLLKYIPVRADESYARQAQVAADIIIK